MTSKLMELYPYSESNTLVQSLRPHVGKKIKSYREPTKVVIQNFSELLNALENEDVVKVEEFRNKLKLGAMKYKFLPNVIMFFPKRKATVAVTFLWRVGKMKIPGDVSTKHHPVDPLILEGPHEGKDGTIQASTNHFTLTKARILLINAVHPKQSDKNPPCQRRAHISDPAHSTTTLFHRVHVQLSQLYPFAFYVQIHGMKPHKNMHLLAVNGYNSNFNTSVKSGPTLYAQSLPNFFNLSECRTFSICSTVPGEAFGRKLTVPNNPANGVFRRPNGCHNTTVQGRHLNGGGQCSVGKRDTGRFLHLEFGPKTKGPWNNRLAQALNQTMKKWNEMPEENVGDIVEIDDELENPEDDIVEEDPEIEEDGDDELAGPDPMEEEDDCEDCEDCEDCDCEDCDCEDCDNGCENQNDFPGNSENFFTNDELELMLMMLKIMRNKIEKKIEKLEI